MLEIPELISSVAILYAIIPCIYAILERTAASVVWSAVVLLTPFAVKLIKSWTIQYPYSEFRRPEGARNCNIWMNNGDQSGAAGFPSGHVATTAAFWAGAWVLVGPDYSTLVLIVGIVATAGMAWGRMQMRCHTELQTAVGAVLGTVVGAGAVSAVVKK
jgi:membrane-associated phospholipid phosphatase